MIFSRKPKREQPPEDSIFLRMLWFLLATTCLILVNMVDPSTASLSLAAIGVPVSIPLMVFYLWLGVAGCFLSYHYRHNPKPWLVGLGLVLIAVIIGWFVDNLHYQFSSGMDIDPLLPTVHLVAGLFVSHTFEMRTRGDFNFSLAISLMLVFMTATLGKGLLFGGLLLVYLCLAGVMLLLDCESRTFGTVCARKIDGLDFSLDNASTGDKTGNLVFPIACMIALGVSLFIAVPRAESIADQLTAKFFRMIRPENNKDNSDAMPTPVRTIRSPIRVPGALRSSFGRNGSAPLAPSIKKPAPDPSDLPGRDIKSGIAGGGSSVPSEGVGSGKSGKEGKGAKPRAGGNSGNDKLSKDKKAGGGGSDGATGQGDKTGSKHGVENGASGKQDSADKTAGSDTESGGKGDSKGGADAKGSVTEDSPGSGKGEGTGPIKGGKQLKNGGKQQKGGDKRSGAASAKISGGNSGLKSDPGPDAHSNNDQDGKDSKNGSSSSEGGEDENEDDEPESMLPEALDTRAQAPDSEQVIFSVVCNRTVFYRKSVLDTFDGHRWYCSDPSQKAMIRKDSHGLFWFPTPSIISIPSTIPSIRLKQQYRFEVPYGSSLPIAGAPDLIAYAAPSLWLDVCGTVHSAWALVKNSEFSAVAVLPMYNTKELMALEPLPPGKEAKVRELLENFLQIEDTVDSRVLKLADEVAGVDGNWFTRAERISLYLRKNYTYTTYRRHSRKVKDTVNNFVLGEKKSGDCKDFASAFVVMCRAAGIPCRFVSGFAPGDFDASLGRRVIRHKDAHAWAEVFVPRGGWVPFDATPQGTLPERTVESERYLTTVNQNIKNALQKSGLTKSGVTVSGAGGDGKLEQHPVSVLTVMLALCFPGLLGYSGLMFWRSLKSGTPRVPRHPASKIYLHFLRTLKGRGVVVRPSSTPAEVQEQLRKKIEEMVTKGTKDSRTGTEFLTKVDGFIDEYNRTYFGGADDIHELRSLSFQVERLIKEL
ncbi:MAG: transglutaminaseTgpA domain-containing protein [Candidatus Obscuribacterales bacterium]|nr:transglutaminaseTgpA domain-containing protein [Candidatus Obscuribacterales bacterium]